MSNDPDTTRRTALLARRRLPALIGLGLVFVLYRPGIEPTLFNDLLLPLLAAICAWLLTGSVLAVSLGIALLAGAHSDPNAADLLDGRVYPLLALAATLVVLAILVRRFREALLRVRAERRRRRQAEVEGGDRD
ncbi:MAG: hypothetical protein U5R48_10515 [Gammaproteobacteria bacterium]|nr:hypothetical protein [Gammaproteobacteria bacterium]